jgi:2-iminobutanoate/2-iminopropanoate deaminase
MSMKQDHNPLIPAKAGIQSFSSASQKMSQSGFDLAWIPAFAGMSGVRGAAAIAALVLTACSAEPPPRVYDRDPTLPADLPFSSAVIVGDMIYLSGEIGRAPGSTTLVEGGVGAETRQIFENYKATLNRLDADLSDIVKCTVFLDDMSKFAEMNAVYAEYFPEEKPARSTFGVDGLALGAALEIECLAVKS